MKTKLTILILAVAMPVMAQLNLINVGSTNDSGGQAVITIPGICTNAPYTLSVIGGSGGGGERIGRNTWVKLNNDLLFLQGLIYQQFSNVTATLPDNLVYSSSLAAIYQTNPFVFSASNYLGSFTNVWSISDYGYSGTNTAKLTNIMSLNGTTWLNFAPTNYYTNAITSYAYTNYYGTNLYVYTNHVTNAVYQPIQYAVLSSITSTGAVTLYQLANPDAWGKTYRFVGDTLDFGGGTLAGGLTGAYTNGTFYHTNGLLMKWTTP